MRETLLHEIKDDMTPRTKTKALWGLVVMIGIVLPFILMQSNANTDEEYVKIYPFLVMNMIGGLKYIFDRRYSGGGCIAAIVRFAAMFIMLPYVIVYFIYIKIYIDVLTTKED